MNDPIVSKVVSSLIRICGGGIKRQPTTCCRSCYRTDCNHDDCISNAAQQANTCSKVNANKCNHHENALSMKEYESNEWIQKLESIALQSISYPHARMTTHGRKRHHPQPSSINNSSNSSSNSQIGKPQDVEVKVALSFFHYFRNQIQEYPKKQQDLCIQSNHSKEAQQDHNYDGAPCLEIISDIGLVRSIRHPVELARLLVEDLEYTLWQERVCDDDDDDDDDNDNDNENDNHDEISRKGADAQNTVSLQEKSNYDGCNLPYEIKYDASGIICIVTPLRNAFLRSHLINRLPCPYQHCTKWVKGEKGLWWHQTREHEKMYSDAVSVARDGSKDGNTLAIVVYVEHLNHEMKMNGKGVCGNNLDEESLLVLKNDDDKHNTIESIQCCNFFETIQNGNMPEFLSCMKDFIDKNIHVATYLDKNGASALHWAAGCGHLDMVRYLVTECNVPPDQPQRGKRSFRNRTPLHWAARNGHLNVVRYLVEDCSSCLITRKHDHCVVDIDAVTLDGTTAFCWACWQGHEEVMQYLYSKGANTAKLNSYGCNAVLWSAQSTTSGLMSLQWLQDIGSDMMIVNSNGHGMLHKSAQRGKEEVCRWIVEAYLVKEGCWQNMLRQIGPDAEGFCPSDLAGIEGFEFLAQWLTMQEGRIALDAFYKGICPEWLSDGISNARHVINRYGLDGIYESGSGVKKMSAFVVKKTGLHSASPEVSI